MITLEYAKAEIAKLGDNLGLDVMGRLAFNVVFKNLPVATFEGTEYVREDQLNCMMEDLKQAYTLKDPSFIRKWDDTPF